MTMFQTSDKLDSFMLNGSKVRSLRSLGKELKQIFYFPECLDLKSWDVISDVMQGGYGILNEQEKIIVTWKNHKTSERYLSQELFNFIAEGFGNQNISVILE